MQALSSWLKQLGFLILLATLVEFILPNAPVRKAVRFVIGLVVLLAVVEPFVGLLSEPRWIDSLFEQVVVSGPADPIAVGRSMAERAEAAATRLWAGDLARGLALALTLLDGVADAAVTLDPARGAERWQVEVRLTADETLAGDAAARTRKEAEVERFVRRWMAPAQVDSMSVTWIESAPPAAGLVGR